MKWQLTPSKSGKTLVVESTRANAKTAAMVNGEPITIGLNAYVLMASDVVKAELLEGAA